MTAGTVADGTRSRLLATALTLFSEHGVEGTSLQMIAAELGVTKAAVYYHFKTKDEITEAVAAPALRELDAVIDEALAQRSRGAQIDHALAGFADLVVQHRALVALFNSDPGIMRAIDRSLSGNENLMTRLMTILVGPEPDFADRITVHVVLVGLAMAGGAVEYRDIDDDTLRGQLIEVGRKLLGRRRKRAPANQNS
ncbi:TetR family transcriptional regulator [Prauserella marina]|uniref:DNA-binding transcriptional regulator, AcrR family n=1 Tax=Prauserella marina TaxID=530584 RepID=A0A222VMI4_9PSEU|nr:TetR/AcrR family transcriptional regulator [Prauserella marina]ASR34941.1 TetR family transcriptional regulator [Prauserella marina]PWV85341.1 TetR family transcriptional regulator [Prauserella marina]SDC57116.1 DNA-binding transcriptional regulator, AcrR family [Prauserella marina]